MGIGHSHGTSRDDSSAVLAFDERLRQRIFAVAALLGLATLVGLVLLWPSQSAVPDLGDLGVPDEYYNATVTRVEEFVCPRGDPDKPVTESEQSIPPDDSGNKIEDPSPRLLCLQLSFRLDAGPDRGKVITTDRTDVADEPPYEVGDGLVVPYLKDALPQFQYAQQFERQRAAPMLLLGTIFAVLVVLQGRLRGLAALAGLVASIGVIILFVLPALMGGGPPVLIAVVAASLIAYLALYLAHGFSPLTSVALLGTLASLLLVVVLSWVFTKLVVLSGLGEETQFLRAFGGNLDWSGLLLAGMILGSLGALDDMTVTQASAVAELRVANPEFGFGQLFRSGSRIGRDHIASTVNTLALAYAGASLPLLLLFVRSEQSLGRVLTSEIVAAEVVRTLVGSIGLVAAVPITTVLAARLVTGRKAASELPPSSDTGFDVSSEPI